MHCHIEPKCSKTRTHHGQRKKTDSTLSRPQFPHPCLEDWIGADFRGLAFDPSLLTEAIDENQTRQPNPWTKRGGNLKSLSGPLTTMDLWIGSGASYCDVPPQCRRAWAIAPSDAGGSAPLPPPDKVWICREVEAAPGRKVRYERREMGE